MSVSRRTLFVALSALTFLWVAGCAPEAAEEAQVLSVPATSVATTPPLSMPTPTPVATPAPTPTSAPLPQATPTPPAVTTAATAAPTLEPAPSATAVPDAGPASTDNAPATEATTVTQTPTPVPTPTTAPPETAGDAAPGPDSDVAAEATTAAETPAAAVAASGEPPLECFDRDVQVYRAFVDGVDALSFEGGRVYCSGAGTNGVSAAGSYRHSSGLVVQRNADYIFNKAGTAYIPYSGFLHFCINAQPASAPIRADTVPALLVVIDAEVQRQLAQGATAPAAFTGTAQC